MSEITPPSPPSADTPVLEYEPLKPDQFHYTLAGLVAAIGWMIFAGAAFTIGESVFPRAMPIQLYKLAVPATYVSIMVTTASMVIMMMVTPFLSYCSDRTRTRWGRRIPYMLVPLLPCCVLLAVLGFSEDIGTHLRAVGGIPSLHLDAPTSIIVVLSVLICLFDFFNTFINIIIFCLIGDVIPPQLLGRFFALFRMVGIGAGTLLNLLAFRYLETATRWIYVASAAVLFFGLLIPCLFLRERKLSPPADTLPHANIFIRFFYAVINYFVQCFSHPIYLSYFAGNAFLRIADAAMFGSIFFYRRHLGLTVTQLGTVGGIISIAGVILALPLGWLIDKIHPMRAFVIALILLVPTSALGFFINGYFFYIAYMVLRLIPTHLKDAADLPLTFRLFPVHQYAQFSSANSLIRSIAMLGSSLAAAYFLNWTVNTMGYGNKAYAFGFLWLAFFQLLALPCFLITFLLWKKHGADNFTYNVDRLQNFRARLSPATPTTPAQFV